MHMLFFFFFNQLGEKSASRKAGKEETGSSNGMVKLLEKLPDTVSAGMMKLRFRIR